MTSARTAAGILLAATIAACGNRLTVERERPRAPDREGEPATPEQVELEGYCEIACEQIDACSVEGSCAATCSRSEAACRSERSLVVYCLQGQILANTCNMPADCTTPLFNWLACRNVGFDGSCDGVPTSCSCDVTDSHGFEYETRCDDGRCVCSVDGEAVAICTQNENDDTAICAPFQDCCAAMFFVPGYPGDTQ